MGGGATMTHIDLTNVNPRSEFTLHELGKIVENVLPKGSSVPAVRAAAKFLWVDVRVSLDEDHGGLAKAWVEQIKNDPLLHQRLFDAVQNEFQKACREIAGLIRNWDRSVGGMQAGPAMRRSSLQGNVLTVQLARNIRERLVAAQTAGISQMGQIITSLQQEVAGKPTKWERRKVKIMIGLGVVGVVCCAVGAAMAIVATGGALGAVMAGAAIYAGARGYLDTLKVVRDLAIGVETLRVRIYETVIVFQKSTKANGPARTAEALSNATFKVGVIAYNLAGSPKFASLSDLKEDLKLYSEKLSTLRAKAHELSGQINGRLDELEKQTKALRAQRALGLQPAGRAGAGANQPNMAPLRAADEPSDMQLQDILTKIPKLHMKCDKDLAVLPALRTAITQVIESRGAVYIQLEKWLDFSINVFVSLLSAGGDYAGFAKEGFKGAADVIAVVGQVDDVISEVSQAVDNKASSKYGG
jgi:hypothetical protein